MFFTVRYKICNFQWRIEMEKLKSRKLWLSIANFVAMMILANNGGYETAAQITAMIMAGGGVVAYILGEAWCDFKRGDGKWAE